MLHHNLAPYHAKRYHGIALLSYRLLREQQAFLQQLLRQDPLVPSVQYDQL